MGAMRILHRNNPRSSGYAEGSFVEQLCEYCVWDDAKYWELEAAVYELASNQPIDQESLAALFSIFDRVSLLLGCHFDPNDTFTLKDRSDEEVQENRERLSLVWEGCFIGQMPSQEMFSVENPLLSSARG